MQRSLWVLCFILLTARPCQAKEKEVVVPPPTDRSVLVSWEDGRLPVKKETQGGTLIAWEPNRSAKTIVAPPIPPIFQPSYGAHQFDIEEAPLMSGQGAAMQAPSRILPAAAAFTPYTAEPVAASQEAPAAPSAPKPRSS